MLGTVFVQAYDITFHFLILRRIALPFSEGGWLSCRETLWSSVCCLCCRLHCFTANASLTLAGCVFASLVFFTSLSSVDYSFFRRYSIWSSLALPLQVMSVNISNLIIWTSLQSSLLDEPIQISKTQTTLGIAWKTATSFPDILRQSNL